MKNYAVNFIALLQYLIPSFLRQPKTIALLTVLLYPLQLLNPKFKAFSDVLTYDVGITCQVIYLEKMLNDKFDNFSRRIYIEDAAQYETNTIRNKIEERHSTEMRNKNEDGDEFFTLRNKVEINSEVDFIVNIPQSVTDLTIINALLRKYTAAGKAYKIRVIQ